MHYIYIEREREEERDREFFLCKKHGKKTPVKSRLLLIMCSLLATCKQCHAAQW